MPFLPTISNTGIDVVTGFIGGLLLGFSLGVFVTALVAARHVIHGDIDGVTYMPTAVETDPSKLTPPTNPGPLIPSTDTRCRSLSTSETPPLLVRCELPAGHPDPNRPLSLIHRCGDIEWKIGCGTVGDKHNPKTIR